MDLLGAHGAAVIVQGNGARPRPQQGISLAADHLDHSPGLSEALGPGGQAEFRKNQCFPGERCSSGRQPGLLPQQPNFQ